jgi:two-component system response regulator (stage 0 sporulation protein A)
MEKRIAEVLKELGIPCNLKGYHYTKTMVGLICNSNIDDVYMGGLYREVARIHNTTATRVERCIRSSVEVGLSRGDSDTWHNLLGVKYVSNKSKPTNSEFVYTLAEFVRLMCTAERSEDNACSSNESSN